MEQLDIICCQIAWEQKHKNCKLDVKRSKGEFKKLEELFIGEGGDGFDDDDDYSLWNNECRSCQ